MTTKLLLRSRLLQHHFTRSTSGVVIHDGKKLNACYLPICGMEIERPKIRGSEKCRIAKFLSTNFFRDEPVAIAAGLGGEVNLAILQHYLSFLDEGLSVYVTVKESKQLLGVAVCHKAEPKDHYTLRQFAERLRDVSARRYIYFLAQVEERANIFKGENSKKVLCVEILCTARPFRRRGVAKLLMKGVGELAREEGFGMIKFGTGSKYAASAATHIGMTSTLKRNMDSYKDPRGVPWIQTPLCPPHSQFDVFLYREGSRAKK